ncbi:hypothetical protein L1887_25381 [Cichorium endivia]|nr:hypothetical protein L1887_25381 [Cichorium endivia]
MEAKTESKKKGRLSLSVNPSQSITSLIRAESFIYCTSSGSSKLYLALTGNTVLRRCEKSKNLLEQSLCQIQNMVPVKLASKILLIITKLRRVKLSLDPYEKEAGEAVKLLLKGYGTGNSSENESHHICPKTGRKFISLVMCYCMLYRFAKMRGINVMAEIDVPGHGESCLEFTINSSKFTTNCLMKFH